MPQPILTTLNKNNGQKMKKLALLLASFAFLASPAFAADADKEPIRIGELFAYTALPDSALKWKQGWDLAVEEVNASGGINGRKLEVISRDDKGNPSEAIKILEEYKNREGIKIFFGTAHSHVGLAASSFAKQNNMMIFRGYGGTSDLVAKDGHDLILSLQPTCDTWGRILAEKAKASGKKRWAFVAADYAMSRSVIDTFQTTLRESMPDVEFVETQYFPIGKLDAGAVTQVVARSKPDGLFVVMWGGDYIKFVREGNKRGLFDGKLVMGPYAGYDGYIKPLGKEAPIGWYSTDAYPLDQIQDPLHKAFVARFRDKYRASPDLSALYAFNVVKILAKAMENVNPDDPAKVVAYIKSHRFEVAGDTLTFRADGLSSMGDWAGYTGFKDGEPTILDPVYFASDKYLPTVEENMKQWKK